jgi:hypothetical protein
MLVHEARARFEGRAPTFGDTEDHRAVALLGLYNEACTKTIRFYKGPERLKKRLEELQQCDAATLEAFLHPRLGGEKRRRHGR